MAQGKMKMPETTEFEPEEKLSQRKRPEVGRFGAPRRRVSPAEEGSAQRVVD